MKQKIKSNIYLTLLALLTIINYSWSNPFHRITKDTSTTYYVSSTEGNDNNTGLLEKAPWQTLEKVSRAHILPGDKILFRSNDVFIGQLAPSYSGKEGAPVIFSAYGKGAKPVINGSTALGGDYLAAIFIHNQQYFNISNLEITNDRKVTRPGNSDEAAYGIYVLADSANALHNFDFSNLTIKNVFAISNLKPFEQPITGIYFYGDRGSKSQIKNVFVDGCYLTYIGKTGLLVAQGAAPSIINNDDSVDRNMNIVLTNNHLYKIGGPGFVLSKAYNCLLDHNIFEYTGSDADPRMAKRGSGAWFNGCTNVVAQYNISKHVRGSGDSYGMHIDFGNKYVIFQYNYFEDNQGGFVEILGKNYQVAYRFNISVDDGFRKSKGNTLWFSTFAGDNAKRTNSNMVFVYNNSVYLNKTLLGDSIHSGIDLTADTAYVYNNIFYAGNDATVGLKKYQFKDGPITIDNNIFFGDINKEFESHDKNAKFSNPMYAQPGGLSSEDYKLLPQSPAVGSGKSLEEVSFPMAGRGIFKNISAKAMVDYFGSVVNFSGKVNVGAYNGTPVQN